MPPSISSGGASSEGGSSAASRDSLGVLGRDGGDGAEADILRGANNSKKVRMRWGAATGFFSGARTPQAAPLCATASRPPPAAALDHARSLA